MGGGLLDYYIIMKPSPRFTSIFFSVSFRRSAHRARYRCETIASWTMVFMASNPTSLATAASMRSLSSGKLASASRRSTRLTSASCSSEGLQSSHSTVAVVALFDAKLELAEARRELRETRNVVHEEDAVFEEADADDEEDEYEENK